MKLVWCPDTASKAYIDGVRAIAANNDSAAADGSPELAELLAAMAGGWNAQLIVDAPASSAPSPSLRSSSTSSSSSRPPATSLALAAAARRTGGRYARLDVDEGPPDPDEDNHFGSGTGTEAAMARLEGVDLLVLDARRNDAAAVLGAARPGPWGMVVVVRHGDTSLGTGGVRVRRRASAAPPWGMAAGTRVVRAAFLPIGAGGVEVLHVGVGKGPGLHTTTTTQQLLHGGHGRRSAGRGRRWIRHVNHRTGEEHVFRRQ